MNRMYALLVDVGFDGCPVCQVELESIGPVHGPMSPPGERIDRWSMTPPEWAGMEI